MLAENYGVLPTWSSMGAGFRCNPGGRKCRNYGYVRGTHVLAKLWH